MTEHPTPWRVNQGTDPIVGDDYVEIMAANGVIVAAMMDIPGRQALAKLIVGSVNCHEELVQALTTYHRMMGNIHMLTQNEVMSVPWRAWMDAKDDAGVKARAALAHAEGRESLGGAS